MMKKLAPIALISILFVGAALPAQAAPVKQGTACAKAGVKAKTGANNYVCTANVTTKKLTWLTTDCITQTAGNVSLVKQLAGYKAQVTTTNTAAQVMLDGASKALVDTYAAAALAESDSYSVGADSTKARLASGRYPDVMVIGRLAAITALNAKVTADGVTIAGWQAKADKLKITMKAAPLSKTDADIALITGSATDRSNTNLTIKNYATYLYAINSLNGTIKSRQDTVARLASIPEKFAATVARLKLTLDRTTKSLTGAKIAQTSMINVYQNELNSTKPILSAICKTGL